MPPADATLEWDNAAATAPRFANPLAIAWRRKALVLLGVVAGLALGVLYYSQKAPSYQSSAQVLVVKKRGNTVPLAGPATQGMQPMYVEDYLATHTILIRSQELLRRAAKLLESSAPGVAPPGDDGAAFISMGLTVARETRDNTATAPSNVLNISFRGRQSEDCPKIVNAVIQAYQDFLNETFDDLNRDFTKQMNEAQKVLQIDIQTKKTQYENIAKKDPLSLTAKDGLAPWLERIAKLEGKQAELLLRETELKTSKVVLHSALKKGQNRALILKKLDRTGAAKQPNAGDPRSPEDVLLALQLQEEELQQEFGKDHPQMLALRRRIQLVKQRLTRAPSPSDPLAGIDPLELFQETLESELEENDMLQRTIVGILRGEREKATEVAEFLRKVEEARKAIEPYQQLFDNINGRLTQIRMTGDTEVYRARTIVDAGPGIKVAPSLFQTGALAAVLGLMIGVGLAYLAEWTDKGFHSPDEIRQRLGLPIVGHVPFLIEPIAGPDATLDGRLVAYHAPGSQPAEAFRGLRTALYFSTQGRGHQVIQMTSPDKGDGKSTLLANLAVSIAQSGKSILLIDADFRRPTIHRLFQLDGAHLGLASVLTGAVELPDALCPCAEVPGLSLLPCGPRPANPAELLTSPRFQELLGVLRERYDFILIDTPPLLAVTDPSVVAPRVDGVLLALRMTKNVRPQAERAKELLLSLGANILGVVVNGSEGFSSGYAYGYGYEYGHAYSEDEDATSDEVALPSRMSKLAAAASRNGTAPTAS